MVSWKDKAKQKLSRLFSSTFRSLSLDSSQARSYSKQKKTSLSAGSSTHSSKRGNGFTSHSDHMIERKGTPVNFRDDQGHELSCTNDNRDKNGAYNASEDLLSNATDKRDMNKSMPYLMEESSFISLDLYEFLLTSLPNIVKGCQWSLLYSTVKHGISLHTLIRRSSDLSGPCLLIVGDKQGAVFGGLLECPLKPTPRRKYQGTNQTFVFTTVYGEPRLFRPTGANRFFYMCLNDLLALGGGGMFALCLDEDLLTGTSGPCETFGNECLAHRPDFELKNVELWGFTHSSRYLG